MTDTLFCDISHWNGVVDWIKFRKAEPYLYAVIFKATQGDATSPYAKDSKFLANKTSCIQYKIPWGAYHYFDPKYDSVAQANHFVATVGTGCNIYVADIETAVGALSPTDMMNRVKKFVERIKYLTGKTPWIYTSYGFWNPWCLNVSPQWWTAYPLWVAHYTTKPEPLIPTGWKSYIGWQYTDKGDGIYYGTESYQLDMNRYNGTPEQCVAAFGNGELPAGIVVPEPPEPPVVEIPKSVIVTAYMLNIRRGAGASYQDIGDTPNGAVWEVIGQDKDVNGKIWYKVAGYVSSDWVKSNE